MWGGRVPETARDRGDVTARPRPDKPGDRHSDQPGVVALPETTWSPRYGTATNRRRKAGTKRFHDTQSRIAEQHAAIERSKAIGAGLKESLELENLKTFVRLRERRLRCLQEWRDPRIAAPNT